MAAPSLKPHAPVLYTFSKDKLAVSLGDFVIKAQDEAIARRSKFTLAVSGGSLAKTLVEGLTGRKEVHWDKWVVFFADERVVPLDHEESNYRIVQQGLFKQVPIPSQNIHAISTTNLEDPEEISHDYEKQLMNEFAAVGDGKKEILHQILDQPEIGLPASLVKPLPPGQVYWFVDEAAASLTAYPKSEFKL